MLAKGNLHTVGYSTKYNANQSEGHGGVATLAKQPIMKACCLAVAQVVKSLTFDHGDLDSIQIQSMWICDGQNGMGTDLLNSTSVLPCQDLSTIAPYAFIIFCQQYIILAVDIIKQHKVKHVLLGIFQEIDCCEWGSCNMLVDVV
jgi:hypothetical protein